MNQLLSLIFILCLSVGLSVLTMVYGWGLHPQNWWWIVGVGIFGQALLSHLAEQKRVQ